MLLGAEAGRESHGTRAGSGDRCTAQVADDGGREDLKGQTRLERHLTRTPAGLAVRIAQRILALTLGILFNALSGRPRTRPRRLRRPLNHIKPLAGRRLNSITC
jgi:hypothetical protein